MPSELYGNFLKTTKEAVDKLMGETEKKDYNLLTNNGRVAGQVVGHFHLHILPRSEGDGFKSGVE